jgi:hypothetical protein
MPQPPSAYDAHQRERWTRHDAHLWIRPDAARFLPLGTDPADVYPTLKRQREAAEDAAFAAKIAASRRFLAALRAEVDELKAALARRRLEESKYSPDQPRVPKRNPGGGQFTRIGGGISQSPSTNTAQPMGNVDVGDVTGSNDVGGLFNIAPDDMRIDGVQLAGDPPDDPKTPLDDPAPKIPQEKPDTREGRMGFVRDAAQWVARNVGRYAPAVDAYFGALDQVEKITALTDAIKSANDPAKTLEELQARVGPASEPGYHDHHIAEEAAARNAGDSESLIQSRDNLVRIPVLKHIDITSYYSTKVEQPDGTMLSRRDQLKDEDFETRRQFGLDVLRKYGVLK